MQMQTPKVMWISLSLSLLLFGSCASDAPAGKVNRNVDPTAALTAQVQKDAAVQAAAAPESAEQQVSGGGRENPNFLNGIDDKNRGDKLGKVQFSGSIKNRTGKLYLFETEGRNVAVIDSVTLVNGQFDFGSVEVGRGFYGLGFEPTKKTGDIIMNPG